MEIALSFSFLAHLLHLFSKPAENQYSMKYWGAVLERLFDLIQLLRIENLPMKVQWTRSVYSTVWKCLNMWSFLENTTLWWKNISEKIPWRWFIIITWKYIFTMKLIKILRIWSRNKLFLFWNLPIISLLDLDEAKTLPNKNRWHCLEHWNMCWGGCALITMAPRAPLIKAPPCLLYQHPHV